LNLAFSNQRDLENTNMELQSDFISLKNLSFKTIHENELSLDGIPNSLVAEFKGLKKCCFFAFEKKYPIDFILADCKEHRADYKNFYDVDEKDCSVVFTGVKWFVRKMCTEAANNGHLNCLKFCLLKGLEKTF
jgi:hypothetical protein